MSGMMASGLDGATCYISHMAKDTKASGTTRIIGRDAKAGTFVVRTSEGKIGTWTINPRSAETMDRAVKRYARVLKRLADK